MVLDELVDQRKLNSLQPIFDDGSAMSNGTKAPSGFLSRKATFHILKENQGYKVSIAGLEANL